MKQDSRLNEYKYIGDLILKKYQKEVDVSGTVSNYYGLALETLKNNASDAPSNTMEKRANIVMRLLFGWGKNDGEGEKGFGDEIIDILYMYAVGQSKEEYRDSLPEVDRIRIFGSMDGQNKRLRETVESLEKENGELREEIEDVNIKLQLNEKELVTVKADKTTNEKTINDLLTEKNQLQGYNQELGISN